MPNTPKIDNSCGFLNNKRSRALFQWINQRPFCEDCQFERKDFCIFDKKKHKSYSNLLPGFSSKEIRIPVEILIIAEAHGGGSDDDFRRQRELNFEVSKFAKYYQSLPLKKFHQQQIRFLLQDLDKENANWIFTDLVKCFVWQGTDRKNNLKGIINKKKAIAHCSKYLKKQIKVLQPKKILGMGKTVASYFGLKNMEHGRAYNIKIYGCPSIYIYSLFPARNTADLWVANEGWKPIIQTLLSVKSNQTS